MTNLIVEVILLLILAIPVACITWTVTKEEIFRGLREFSELKMANSRSVVVKKFYYPITCEYCFSHYVVVLVLAFSRFTLIFSDWRGYVVAGFSLVWIANVYMNLFALIRVDLRKNRLVAEKIENET